MHSFSVRRELLEFGSRNFASDLVMFRDGLSLQISSPVQSRAGLDNIFWDYVLAMLLADIEYGLSALQQPAR